MQYLCCMKRICLYILICLLALSVSAQQRHSDAIDDVLEHTPMASVLILKACGLDSRSESWEQLGFSAGVAYGIAGGTTLILKHIIKKERPDHSDNYSFPSGHATFAFAGAHTLHKEFGRHSPWVSVAGYSVATFVAIDRVAKNRHRWYDVTTGAAIGVLGTELSYWLSDRVFKTDKVSVSVSPAGMDLAIRF